MRNLLVVAALVVGSVVGVGQSSEAVTEWKTIASAKVVVPSVGSPRALAGFASVGALATNPERLRIVFDGSRSGEPSMFVNWHVQCWREQPFRSVDRGRFFSPTKLPVTVRLTDRVPGGVGAWDFCFVEINVTKSARGVFKILVQARYP
jgi:hypothetical protein